MIQRGQGGRLLSSLGLSHFFMLPQTSFGPKNRVFAESFSFGCLEAYRLLSLQGPIVGVK